MYQRQEIVVISGSNFGNIDKDEEKPTRQIVVKDSHNLSNQE